VERVTQDSDGPARYRVARAAAWVDSVEGQSPGVGVGDDAVAPEAWVALVPDGEPLSLNGSALLIWRALEDGGTAAEVTARVRAAIGNDDVPEEQVASFLETLAERGLVQRAGGLT
jgi:hypothetical protein